LQFRVRTKPQAQSSIKLKPIASSKLSAHTAEITPYLDLRKPSLFSQLPELTPEDEDNYEEISKENKALKD
jgi:hypothetical protein